MRPSGPIGVRQPVVFNVAIEQEAALEVGLRVVAEPGLDIDARPFRVRAHRVDLHRYAVRLAFPARGDWSLALLIITGDGILEQARVPVAVVEPAAPKQVPAGLAWFAWHWKTRRRPWDWRAEMPMLLLVSIISTWYAWFTDEVILIPVLFSFVATIGKRAWESSALFYLFLNVAGIALAVGHHIYLQAWIPILWLGYLLRDRRFFPVREIEPVDSMAEK